MEFEKSKRPRPPSPKEHFCSDLYHQFKNFKHINILVVIYEKKTEDDKRRVLLFI